MSRAAARSHLVPISTRPSGQAIALCRGLLKTGIQGTVFNPYDSKMIFVEIYLNRIETKIILYID
jgi:hypothetical protein